MLKEFHDNLGDIERRSFKLHLEDVNYQINNKFPDFNSEEHSSLIEDYLVLRKLFVSKTLSLSEESEANNIFDSIHSEIIDNDEVNKVLKFVTEITAKPFVEKKRT